jgi:adenosylhomocysteine nucleosidase
MMLFVLLLMCAAHQQSVGIMGAMDVELALLHEDMIVQRVDTVASRVFTVGELNGVHCICVKAGVGKVNAALSAEILILKYGVDAIIFTGVAGGINPELCIGDIVISQNILHHDFGQIVPGGFMPWDTLGYQADSQLVAMTRQASGTISFDRVPNELSKEKDRTPEVIVGTVVTGDQFIASETKRKWLEETYAADCVEMEGAAVAQVCVINKIPFVIIRCLSDLANESANIDFESFVMYAAKNSSDIVKEVLRNFDDDGDVKK